MRGDSAMTTGWSPRAVRIAEAVTAVVFLGAVEVFLAAAVPEPWNLPAALCGLVALVWAAHRAFRISFAFDDDTIVVSNYFRSYRLPWAEVVGVRSGFKTLGIVPLPAIELLRRGGSSVRVQASVGGGRIRAEMADAVVGAAHARGISVTTWRKSGLV